MSNKLVLLLLVAAIQVVRIAALNVAISPVHGRVSQAPSSVNFTCTADSALAGCQFMWWDWDNKASGPLLDLSRGPQSQANPALLKGALTSYSYTGQGLGTGECGVSLFLNGRNEWIVACRVRAETGGWKYAWTDLLADNLPFFPHNPTSTPREVVVRPGGEAHFMLKAQETPRSCDFYLMSESRNLDSSQRQRASDGRHLYFGDGLESGECRFALINISETDNGPVRVYILGPRLKVDVRFMAIIVAQPPPAPTIRLNYTGTNITATCRAGYSRPVANISWILGDKVIRQGEETLDDSWRWPWMADSNLQTLTLQLKPEDQGQVLKCVVSHIALVQPLEARAIITGAAPNCLATNYLDLLCLQASQHGNTSCPKDEVREYRVREAKAAARAAEMEEEVTRKKLEAENITIEAAKVALEAAAKAAARAAEMEEEVTRKKLEAENTTIKAAKVALEASKVALEAVKSSAKAAARAAEMEEEVTRKKLDAENITIEAAKVALEAAAKAAVRAAEMEEEVTRKKLDAENITIEVAKVSLEASKVALEAAKSNAKAAARAAEMEEKVTNMTLQVATMKLEAENRTIEADKTKGLELKVAHDATRNTLAAAEYSVKAEMARARAEEARALNAEEELQSQRERRAKHQWTATEPSE